MSELKNPVELTTSELDIVAGGRATAFVKQSNSARVAIGNGNSVTNGSGDVAIGDANWVSIDEFELQLWCCDCNEQLTLHLVLPGSQSGSSPS